MEERRWPLIGYKNTEIHSGYGIVEIIKWRDNYMAWANEKVTLHISILICYISFSLDSFCLQRGNQVFNNLHQI